MRQWLHLVQWDIRRLRVVLVGWFTIVAAYALVGFIRPLVAAEPSLAESAGVASGLLWLTMLLLTMAMVSFSVHGDPTVGTDAFWMTRPIRPLSLLASKLALLAAALLALPVLTEGILLLTNGMSLAVSTGVMLQSFFFRLIVMLFLILAAALTRNLPRFALLCGGAVLVVAAGLAAFVAIEVGDLGDDMPVRTNQAEESAGSSVVLTVLVAIAVLTTLAVQYTWRLRRRAVIVAVVTLVAAERAASLWPFEFLAVRRIVPAWAESPAALNLSVDVATISTNRPHAVFPGRSRWSTANGMLHISRPETGWMADVALRDAAVHLPNGPTLRSPAAWGSAPFLAGGPMRLEQHLVVRDLLGVRLLGNIAPAQPEELRRPETFPILFLMRQDEFAQHAGGRGSYHGRFDVSLTHFDIEGVLAIVPGATHRSGGYRLVIDRTITINGEPALVARETHASSIWDRRPWTRYSYYLRNRERQQAIEVSDYALHRGFALFRYLPMGNFSFGAGTDQFNGFSTQGVVLSFPPRYTPGAETLDIDDAWLAGAELVIVRQTQEGSVQRSLEIRDFPL